MEVKTVKLEKPEDSNIIIGQSHFIKSVDDIYEALVNSVPGIKFGLAFCEASGPCLVRSEGTEPKLQKIAIKNALNMGAGHTFIILLKDAYPVNVLNALKSVPEVCSVFCATANPVSVVVAEDKSGRGILGVIDGCSPKGVENDGDVKKRKEFLRTIGYKL